MFQPDQPHILFVFDDDEGNFHKHDCGIGSALERFPTVPTLPPRTEFHRQTLQLGAPRHGVGCGAQQRQHLLLLLDLVFGQHRVVLWRGKTRTHDT